MSATSPPIDPRLLERLPTLPGSAVEFLRLCDDPTAGVKDVAEVARRDPALLARILQVANSPFYAPREPVVDVARAAAILGLRSMKMIGVGFAILGDLWSQTASSEHLSGIIAASTMAGSGARSFSAHIGTGRDEEALTSGLLAYIGDLALLRAYPDEFAAYWDSGSFLEGEALEALPVDGPSVGVALMEHWLIPAELRGGAKVRTMPLAARLQRSPSVFDAALGFGTAIADLLATRQEKAIEELRSSARMWGLTDKELMMFWGEFRVASRRTVQQLGLDLGSELDSVIREARDEYLASPLAAVDQLESAQRELAELRAENERLEGLSLHDPLTGVPNRAAFDANLRSALASLDRHPDESRVGVALFDLDYFKQVNDSEGHLVGDELLRAAASAAQEAVREDELFARLGGDEFALILRPDSPEAMAAGTERIRSAMVAAADRVRSGSTVSAGAALLEATGGDVPGATESLIRAADDALYEAKRRGRNQTCVNAAVRC